MSHRPARINPDSFPVLVVAVVITVALALTSFLLSYSGLVAVAEWAAVPAWLAWAVPVTIDGAILVYTLAALVFRARAESARVAWASLSLFTGLSVAANAAHAWDAGAADGRAVLGAIIAGLAPVAVLLTTHTIARLIIARPAPVADVERWDTVELAPFVEAHAATLRELAEATDTPPHLVAPEPAPRPVVAATRNPSARPARGPVMGKALDARNARIRELAATEGLSTRAIAERVGCSKSTVARVLETPAEAPAERPVAAALA